MSNEPIYVPLMPLIKRALKENKKLVDQRLTVRFVIKKSDFNTIQNKLKNLNLIRIKTRYY